MAPVLIVAALVWEVTAPAQVTTADSIDVRVELRNRGTAVQRWNPGPPTISLIPERGRARSLPVPDRMQQSGNVDPPPGEAAYSAQFDLRRLFGRLPAGRYQLRVGPARAAFAVTDTTLAAAERANPGIAGLDLVVEPLVIVDKAWRRPETAHLHNHTADPVSFRAYTWGHDPKTPLMPIITWERWHPALGWSSPAGQFGWCGTGLGEQTTAPGASEWLHVMHTSLTDGIYRYVLEVDRGGAKVRVTSQAIQIDNLAAYP